MKIFFEDPGWFYLCLFGQSYVDTAEHACTQIDSRNDEKMSICLPLALYRRQAKETGISNRYTLANRCDCYSQADSGSGVRAGTCSFPSKACAFIDQALANLTFTPYLKRKKDQLGNLLFCFESLFCSVFLHLHNEGIGLKRSLT